MLTWWQALCSIGTEVFQSFCLQGTFSVSLSLPRNPGVLHRTGAHSWWWAEATPGGSHHCSGQSRNPAADFRGRSGQAVYGETDLSWKIFVLRNTQWAIARPQSSPECSWRDPAWEEEQETYVRDGASICEGRLRRWPCAGDAFCDASSWQWTQGRSCRKTTKSERLQAWAGLSACLLPPHKPISWQSMETDGDKDCSRYKTNARGCLGWQPFRLENLWALYLKHL